MGLFEHREEQAADSANQRRQLLEVQGMGAPPLCFSFVFLRCISPVAFCDTLWVGEPAACPPQPAPPAAPFRPPSAVLLHVDMAVKHDAELAQVLP